MAPPRPPSISLSRVECAPISAQRYHLDGGGLRQLLELVVCLERKRQARLVRGQRGVAAQWWTGPQLRVSRESGPLLTRTPWYYEGGAISGHERRNPLHGHPGIQRSWGYVGIARWNPDCGWTGIARAEENRTMEDICRWNPGWGWVGIARGYGPHEYTGFGWVGNGRWSWVSALKNERSAPLGQVSRMRHYGWVGCQGALVSPAYHGWGWFGIARWHPAACGWGWTGIAGWLDSYFGVLGHVGLGRWNHFISIGVAGGAGCRPVIQRWGWAPPGIQRWGWMSPGFQRWGWGPPGIQRI
ncbi:unnamed protein product [Vitrella brassicaformis CCMP3155]|uniref:Uncharacterized protein n=1 Tax=Vitrella brassicaformis (strain CCMP3155) TaxID=1169540 RepID=A0A0G4GQ41_VITBC|nr:unnamed protein product [Vitrella brassicaformis CCMP3155]|eukprot:CEM32503.1 unnamed protein product [Vitrella brassicaformis CCMP3155]